MVAIFDLTLSVMSESVQICPAMLLNHENAGVAFGISLLSCTEAEILRYSMSTSGKSGHLQFTGYPDVGQYPH